MSEPAYPMLTWDAPPAAAEGPSVLPSGEVVPATWTGFDPPTVPTVPPRKILIDAGPSPRGAHRLELIATCPQLYAYHQILKKDLGDRTPLVRGGMGHVGLAHHYARLKAKQEHRDPEAYYEPHEAIDLAAKEFGSMGDGLRPLVHKAVDAYLASYTMERFLVHEVEGLHETFFPASFPTPWKLPDGRFAHWVTARWDLVVKDSSGRFWIYDHKFVYRVDARTVMRYTNAIQFVLMQHMGLQTFGALFGGIRLNLIGVNDAKVKRESPEAAPNLVLRLPQQVDDLEATAKRLETRNPMDYPKAMSEKVCMTPYGPCDAFDLCRWGE